jgi:Skp family chaperone for outer membrane proteins
MKNNIWFIISCILVFFVGYNMNNAANSFSKYKVAVIDVPTIMSKSGEIQELQRNQQKETDELNTLISKAQNELLNEQDKSKLLQKEATYRQEIETKRSSMDREYNTRLAKINEDIKNTISKEAKKENFNLVLPAGMVISGGEDITNEVLKKIK